MRKTSFRPLTFVLLAVLLWLGFRLPFASAQTQFLSKITGRATVVTNGLSISLDGGNPFYKTGFDHLTRLVLDLGISTNAVQTITNEITNEVSVVITNGITNSVTNQVTLTVTNSINESSLNEISILDLDPQGNVVTMIYQFAYVSSLADIHGNVRIFAMGMGCSQLGTDCPTNAVLGQIELNYASMTGILYLNPNGAPKRALLNFHGDGNSDLGPILVNGSINAKFPFVPQ